MKARSPDTPVAHDPARAAPSLLSARLAIRPLTPARWPDLEAIFQARGCSVARGCWCMWYRESGAPAIPAGSSRRAVRQQGLRRLVDAATPPGLLAYHGKTPVGWVSLGPRGDFAKLRRSPVMKAVDDRPVWSIICFVVPSAYRGQGVARRLLQGAIAYAAQCGAQELEAYPVDRDSHSADEATWFGAKSMFDAAGFVEIVRRKPARPLMRLALERRA